MGWAVTTRSLQCVKRTLYRDQFNRRFALLNDGTFNPSFISCALDTETCRTIKTSSLPSIKATARRIKVDRFITKYSSLHVHKCLHSESENTTLQTTHHIKNRTHHLQKTFIANPLREHQSTSTRYHPCVTTL